MPVRVQLDLAHRQSRAAEAMTVLSRRQLAAMHYAAAERTGGFVFAICRRPIQASMVAERGVMAVAVIAVQLGV